MNGNSDEIAQGIFNVLFVLSIGALLGSLLTHHPIIIGLAVSIFAVCALLKYAYTRIREVLGNSSDLLFGAVFLAIAYLLVSQDKDFSSPLKEIFAVIFWGSVIFSYYFFKAFIKSFKKSD